MKPELRDRLHFSHTACKLSRDVFLPCRYKHSRLEEISPCGVNFFTDCTVHFLQKDLGIFTL